MKKATKILSVLLVLALALVMVGCGPDSVKPTPTYLFNSSLTINSFDGIELDAKGNDVIWSIKGCDNGDDDVNNDLATYDATGKIKIENGKVIPLVPTGTARVFGTLKSDTYRYGFYDYTWDIAIADADPVTIAANVGVDTTTGWWSTFGDIIQVPFWTSKTVKFVNHGSGAYNWNNFIVILQNVAAGHSAGDDASYKEYAVVRPDNYGWNAAGNSGELGWELTSNHNWADFIANLNGATVTVKVINKGTTADIEMSWKGVSDDVDYFQNYKNIAVDGDLYFCLGVDGAYLEPVALEGTSEGGEEPENPPAAFAGWAMSLDNVKTALATYAGTQDPPKLTIGDDPIVIDTAYIVYSKKEQLRLRADGTLNFNGGTSDAFAVSTVGGTFTDSLDRYVGVDTSKFDATGNIKVTFSVLTKSSGSATSDTGIVVLFNDSTKEVLAAKNDVALSTGSQSFDIEATVAAGAKVILGFSRGGAGAGGIDITAITVE